MSSFWYDHAAYLLAHGTLDLDSDTLKVALVMTNTTADTEKDKATLSGFTTLDRGDGTNYADKTLASVTDTEDNTNHRAYIDCADVTWSALGAGTRNYQGAVVYKFVTDDTDSIPVAYIDSGGFPFAGNGGDVTMQINAAGLLRLQA